ncbi:N-acetylglucosamine-6-phosphate deacetylase [Endozoicomonas sp. OPT23]|uniref:N-acetylglucosamine-6-phosphate deacetylase n=1 Tax=Endozoicomonas sp. OPT23 TaxID=2072845 RepID=UPI00129AE765|nr:N-acetylglucosamine-6-phosphate deacetylase [Endozoicomonas sp. OPT23]MRI34073.1 N-acetylglucosamine-6-phosphate deacetylase [Endozoicomonas sp. OPT23]
MDSYYIEAEQIFSEAGILGNACLKVDRGFITAINPDIRNLDIPTIDLTQHSLLPGLIDLHIHGCAGHDVMDDNDQAVPTISSALASRGVTAFLATTATAEWQRTLQCFQRLGKASKQVLPGAQMLGIYSEGLFFTEKNKGAHDSQLFLSPTKERLSALIKAADGALKQLALAPELPEAIDAIHYLKEQGIKTSIGHSDASYEQAMAAIKAGTEAGVHVFNGMKGLHHREPGCTGAVLTEDHVLAELIADGIHVHPAILSLVARVKGWQKTALISDCNCAGMMPDGDYKIGSMDFNVLDGVARTANGSLAGSTLSLNNAVKNMIELAGVTPIEAVHMASLSPARHIGIDKSHGSITVGKRADFCAVDSSFNVQATWVKGKKVFSL